MSVVHSCAAASTPVSRLIRGVGELASTPNIAVRECEQPCASQENLA